MICSFMPAMIVVAMISAVFLICWSLLGTLVTCEIFVYFGVSIGSIGRVGPATSLAQAYDSRISANLADCIGASVLIAMQGKHAELVERRTASIAVSSRLKRENRRFSFETLERLRLYLHHS